MHSSPNACDWSDHISDLVDRLLDECALTEGSGTGDRCVQYGDSLGSTLILALVVGHYFAFWKRLARCIWSASNVVMSFADHCVLWRRPSMTTCSRLQVSPQTHLKEKHLTTKSGRRRKLCEDYEKALTLELSAKRMKTGNQLARIDGVDTKCLRKTLSKEMLAHQCAGFRTFHDLRGVFSCTEDGTRMEEPAEEKIAYFATQVGTNIAMALPIQVCGSQTQGAKQLSKHHLHKKFSFTYDTLF